MSEDVKKQVTSYRDYFLCMNSEDTRVNGEYDSFAGRMIYVRLNYNCKIEGKCSDEEKSKQLFKGGYMFLLANRIRFDNKKYG